MLIGNEEAYLNSLVPTGWLTEEAVIRAKCILSGLRQRVPGLGIAQIGLGPDNSVGFNWRDKDNYFCVDIMPEQPIEYFHEQLTGGLGLWSEESFELSDTFVDMLKKFVEVEREQRDCQARKTT